MGYLHIPGENETTGEKALRRWETIHKELIRDIRTRHHKPTEDYDAPMGGSSTVPGNRRGRAQRDARATFYDGHQGEPFVATWTFFWALLGVAAVVGAGGGFLIGRILRHYQQKKLQPKTDAKQIVGKLGLDLLGAS